MTDREKLMDLIIQAKRANPETGNFAEYLADFLLGYGVKLPDRRPPDEPLTVTEVCPHCESEVTMEWNVEVWGYRAHCPVCGNRLMLCDECQHGESIYSCDYDSNTDMCRFNRRPPEGEA